MNSLIHEPAWRVALFCLFAGGVSFFSIVSIARQISRERQNRIKEEMARFRRAQNDAEDDADDLLLTASVKPASLLPRLATIGLHSLVVAGSLAFGLPSLTFARYTHLGNAAFAAHDYDGAIAKYDIALAANPAASTLNAQVQYATAQHDAGAGSDLGDMRRLVNLHPGNGGNHNDLGTALLNRGEVSNAIKEYKLALELIPQDPAVHNNMGNAYMADHHYPEAIAEFHKALQIAPNQEQTYFNLANVMVATKQMEEAIKYYRIAIEKNPHLAPAYYNMADAFALQGKRSDAVAALDKFVKVASNQPVYANSVTVAKQQLTKWRVASN